MIALCKLEIVKGQDQSWRTDPRSVPPYTGNINQGFNNTRITTGNSTSSPGVCDGPDQRIFPTNNPQSEVHISIDKNNPLNIVVSANTYKNDYQQGRYVSNDGGNSWTGSDELVTNVPVAGDPSTTYDYSGNVYISTITSNQNGFNILKSMDRGQTWSGFSTFNVTSGGFDKEMIAADAFGSSQFKNNLYCAWTDFSSPFSVKLNRSIDGANTFSSPISLKNGFGQGTNIQTGPNGEVYVCYADYGTSGNLPASGLGFVRSIDGGITFSPSQLAFTYVGIRTSNSALPQFNGIRVNDFPAMAVDKSTGSHRGRIYVVYAAQKNGNGNAIIQLRFSDDRGSTWSAPKEISISGGTQNWFPWITVDDVTGGVYVIYYSFDTSIAFETNTYVAATSDGGNSFVNYKVSDVSHITAPINSSLSVPVFNPSYAGDYIGIAANGGKVYSAWMDNRNGTWQVYVSVLNDMTLNRIIGSSIVCSTSNYSLQNPPSSGTTLSWSSSYPSGLSINSSTGIATRVNNFNGYATISATVTGSCPAQLTPVSAYVGLPGADINTLIYVSGKRGTNPVSLNPLATYNFKCDPVAGATNFNWVLPNGFSFYSGNTTPSPYITTSLTSGHYTLYCSANNVCGSSWTHDLGINVLTGGGGCCPGAAVVRASPNPTSNTLTIQVSDSLTNNMNISTLDQPYQVLLYDRFSKKVFSTESSNNTIQIPTEGLSPDIYYLNVLFKGRVFQDKIVIKR